jgi:hypothetical protein
MSDFLPLTALLGQHVRCYRNLHNGLFSVLLRGKVVAHLPAVTLADATFVVQPGGRARVLRESKKYVHAFVCGRVVAPVELTHRVGYNPHAGASFRAQDGTPVTAAALATLSGTGVYT